MHIMYGAIATSPTSPVKLWKTSDRKVISIKEISGKMMPARGRKPNPAPQSRCGLSVDELALEETFYVFDYGNAM